MRFAHWHDQFGFQVLTMFLKTVLGIVDDEVHQASVDLVRLDKAKPVLTALYRAVPHLRLKHDGEDESLR